MTFKLIKRRPYLRQYGVKIQIFDPKNDDPNDWPATVKIFCPCGLEIPDGNLFPHLESCKAALIHAAQALMEE